MSESSAALPSVAVLGSCVTRDNFNSRFNPEHSSVFRLVAQANQMSLISLMAPPLEVSWLATGDMKAFDQWNVNEEFSKGFLESLVAGQPDYVVVDLFGDVHFGAIQVDGATWVTDNRWKIHRTDWYQRLEAEGRLRHLNVYDHTEEYLELWRDAVQRLRSFLDERSPQSTVVINRGRNTDALWVPEHPRPIGLRANRKVKRIDVDAANAMWSRLDDEQTALLRAESIDLTGIDFGTYDEHPWGPFYVHYQPEYYWLFLAELRRVHASRTASSADIQAALEALDHAWRRQATTSTERFAALSERLQQRNSVIGQQKARLSDLEARVSQLESGLAARIVRKVRRLGR